MTDPHLKEPQEAQVETPPPAEEGPTGPPPKKAGADLIAAVKARLALPPAEETPPEIPLTGLGRLLEENRTPRRRQFWRLVMFGFLALLVLLNLVIWNHHPHFGVDRVPEFWAVFSFVMGVAMIFFVKKIVQPLIKRPEDYYGDL